MQMHTHTHKCKYGKHAIIFVASVDYAACMHMLINVRNPPMTMSAVGCGPPKGSGEQIVDAAVFTI